MEHLTSTAESLRNSEPISAHPDKLREQLEENKAVDEDVQLRSQAMADVREAADELLKQAGPEAGSDPAVRGEASSSFQTLIIEIITVAYDMTIHVTFVFECWFIIF